MPRPTRLYNCDRCPAYCCSYSNIHVTKRDLQRIARHLGMTEADVRAKYTKPGETARQTALLHREDEHYTTACHFLDPDTRGCTIYEARPAICRAFPGTARCGYYDFLTFERRTQDDPDWVATTG